jgi:hypothetical protein
MPAPPTAKRIEMWPLDRLVPYERNARTHSAEQVAQIVASIREFGFTNPLLVDGADGILAGHGRLAAAKDMGLAEVPVIVLDHLSAAQRKAYILADNQLALNAGWDMELLQQEIVGLNLADFDLSLLGFDDDLISGLLDPEGIDSGSAAPETVTGGEEGGEGGDDEGGSDNPYTGKVDVAPYEITGPKPEVIDLYDCDKTQRLIDAIDNSDLPEQEKTFLRAAAYRHSVFNFQKIAEYYAHSEADVQSLMEDSALVIVDIGKAIEEGWAKLSADLSNLFQAEKGGSDAK